MSNTKQIKQANPQTLDQAREAAAAAQRTLNSKESSLESAKQKAYGAVRAYSAFLLSEIGEASIQAMHNAKGKAAKDAARKDHPALEQERGLYKSKFVGSASGKQRSNLQARADVYWGRVLSDALTVAKNQHREAEARELEAQADKLAKDGKKSQAKELRDKAETKRQSVDSNPRPGQSKTVQQKIESDVKRILEGIAKEENPTSAQVAFAKDLRGLMTKHFDIDYSHEES